MHLLSKELNKVTDKLRPKTSFGFFCFYYIEIRYKVLIKFNHKKRGGKLNLKLVVGFVDCLQLFEGVVGKAEHVIPFIKFP